MPVAGAKTRTCVPVRCYVNAARAEPVVFDAGDFLLERRPLVWYDFGFGLVDESAATVRRGIGASSDREGPRIGELARAGDRTGQSRELLNVNPGMSWEFV